MPWDVFDMLIAPAASGPGPPPQRLLPWIALLDAVLLWHGATCLNSAATTSGSCLSWPQSSQTRMGRMEEKKLLKAAGT